MKATDSIIIHFIESNILSRFGCPKKIITNNVVAFKSKKLVELSLKYHIVLEHFIAYHPQGNGLAKSSNKYLINIINMLGIILRGRGLNQYLQINNFFHFIIRFIYATSVKGTRVCMQLFLRQPTYI